VARACRQLADLDAGDDTWDPPYLPYVDPAQRCRDPWNPPGGMTDALTGAPAGVDGDGLIVVLGTGRLSAAEEAVRSADRVTVAVVTADPAESGALVRLRITDLVGCLTQVFGPAFRPSLRLVLDFSGALASAAGAAAADDTEAAVLVRGGEIVARARGRGAACAAAR
jgi:hypothetical protein